MSYKIKPNIVWKVDEILKEEKKVRTQKWKNKKEEVAEDGGEWVFNPEYREYFCIGDGEPVF